MGFLWEPLLMPNEQGQNSRIRDTGEHRVQVLWLGTVSSMRFHGAPFWIESPAMQQSSIRLKSQ